MRDTASGIERRQVRQEEYHMCFSKKDDLENAREREHVL